MKTILENKKLFEEAHELRINIRNCLHSKAKNISNKELCLSKTIDLIPENQDQPRDKKA
jgi:hypothetical protein